jgi:selenocysteine-specific elongation factor
MALAGLVVALGRRAIGPGALIYTAAGLAAVSEKVRQFLEAYHGQYPLRKGAPKEELRSRLGMTPHVYGAVLPRLQEDGVVVEEVTLVRTPGHAPHLAGDKEEIAARYLRSLETEPYSPPTDAPFDQEVLGLLADEGKVVKVSESVVFAASAYEAMVEQVSQYIRERGEITVADVRDMFGTSRKYALALMDYLDQQRITRRVGDARVLR